MLADLYAVADRFLSDPANLPPLLAVVTIAAALGIAAALVATIDDRLRARNDRARAEHLAQIRAGDVDPFA